ncbi:MAG: type IV pilus modification protein PilV [Steroidobacteraceae bacterium]
MARGFGLVEVLVTLAIAGIGLLGQALLLQHGLAAESAALRRAQATTLLAALAERMRANAAARADYALPAGAPSPALPACAASAGCTPAESATADLAEWLEQVAAALPPAPAGPAALVELTPGAGGTDHALITLRWAEPGTSGPATLSLGLVLPGAGP